MLRRLKKMSLGAQVFGVVAVCVTLMAAAALLATTVAMRGTGDRLRLALIGALVLAALVSIGIVMVAVQRLLLDPLKRLDQHLNHLVEGRLEASIDTLPMPSRDLQRVRDTFNLMVERIRSARDRYEDAQRVLAVRSSTVDRLLDFSQTIQGAGTVAAVFQSLCHYLRTELRLAGIVIVTFEADQTPAMQLRAAWPETCLRPGADVGTMESASCPCLRQHLPKSFRLDGSPVRCAIDSCLSLGPEHPAYCIPFNVGRAVQAVVHMLLPVEETWTQDRKQLAQTYVNSAISSLTSLHLLAEAEKQSMTDVLTGLYNRRSLESLLQREVALAERHGHALSLVMIDMDRFKEVNDAYGHAAGDHMLKAFADCVRMTLRKTDLAFRYGGDEFVIALPQTPIAQTVQVVHKLRQAFGTVDFSHAIARLEHQPTLSLGIAERSAAHNTLTLSALLTAADQALYEAKSSTRNCVKLYQAPKAEQPPTKVA
jgi:diguanylate cyclase (GGDEF)-like protein